MTRLFYIAFIAMVLQGCGFDTQREALMLPYPPSKLDVEVEVLFENVEKHHFGLKWSDTLGNTPEGNMYELHCYVRDSKGLIAHYTGLSTEMTHVDFITEDSVIQVFFQKRFRLSTDIGMVPFDQIGNLSEFKPVMVNIIRYETQEFVLETNPEVVRLMEAMSPGIPGDAMPMIFPPSYITWAKARYYLNESNGKIYLGQKWLEKLGVRACMEAKMRIVDPQVDYMNKDGVTYSGIELIDNKGLNTEDFDLEQFAVFENSVPYEI